MDQSELTIDVVDSAVAEGGAYEIIRKRLDEQGKQLEQATQRLNEARLLEFGSTEMRVVARTRVRTENNCIARDIVQIGEYLLFGYNVYIGLKTETKIDDVFSLFQLKDEADSYELVPIKTQGTFLSSQSFLNDFHELYNYYKNARLIQLSVINRRLLAGFQIGERLDDIRVFRWSVSADGKDIDYIDNRGERDIQLPSPWDFEWIKTSREDYVEGRHAHINILDSVFVETIGGDLTVKVENNTDDGLGIYRETVVDQNQSLDDAEFLYANLGNLILLKIKPYRENEWRYLIFNRTTQVVLRMDTIGESCVQLPEDHGIIFPGGYYLQSGEYKSFADKVPGLRFKRSIRSPNGEDVLYIFYEPEHGLVNLLSYNLITKELLNPIYSNGYAIYEDGKIIIFSAEDEPTRVHPMQIWATPYVSVEYASNEVQSQTFFGRIGNAELVRGISALFSIWRIISNQSVSVGLYEELTTACKDIFDNHFWVEDEETKGIDELLKEIAATAELVVGEFEKVESIRRQSSQTMHEAEQAQTRLLNAIQPDNWEKVEDYVDSLSKLRHQRGHLTTIKEYRYIDLDLIEQLNDQLTTTEEDLSHRTVEFLTSDNALKPYYEKIDLFTTQLECSDSIATLTPVIEHIETTAAGLDLLSELMGTLKIEDTGFRIRIIESISEVYSRLNQCKAGAKHKQKNLGSAEAIAQFSAQFKLFSQSITNALGLATTPDRCEEQLSRLLVQLEELESQFSDSEQFLVDIMDKREEIYETFETRKQQLLDEQQRKSQSVNEAAERILGSIEKRSLKFTDTDQLNTYFSSDALVLKTHELAGQLRKLDSAIKADDVDSRFKAIKEQALRALRDKKDIFEDGGNLIKLGPRHKFSVNTQELDLTIIPRNGELNLHLTGTNYFEVITCPELIELREYWDLSLESESPDVYRAEYLAYSILQSAQKGLHDQDIVRLHSVLNDDAMLIPLVRSYAAARYREGYEKGIHDHDAALILKQLVPALESAELLQYDPLCRGLAQIYWSNLGKSLVDKQTREISHETWAERAQSAFQMLTVFGSRRAIELLVAEVNTAITEFLAHQSVDVTELDVSRAAEYLVAELGRQRLEFISSKYARQLVMELQQSLDDASMRLYQKALDNLSGWPAQRWNLTSAWFESLVDAKGLQTLKRYIPEAVSLINCEERIDRRFTEVDLEIGINGLLGEHSTITNRTLSFSVDAFLRRLNRHQHVVIPAYQRYLRVRQDIIAEQREKLMLDQYKAKPLSSFVRNRLINEAYLPIIGDNLAKQIGAFGAGKRTDLMGLLMMISPPGYGKTTLMEYVASRLGLIFMKINCPSLGHDVLSLDPEQAPNATARQELEKLNLSLEMGNNVMLYLDDIQHTHPEFLQKFISLCDGTRRIEGIWKKRSKTYDLRGRKFCVVMAGNPYTESGEAFKVPDMLANRADIYNLGDILSGLDEQFALSYIENSLTSNSVLAPLATREMDDVYKFTNMARGVNVATTELSHQYSGAEINEITEVLKKLFVIQEVILKINQQYIASAAQDDKYRTEPPFRLQGSYRNMNKMAEKVSAVMNDVEIMQLIDDHYQGEAQLLTTGAESNLLKLAELQDIATAEQQQRWQQIKKDFIRNKAMGGDDSDVGGKIVAQLLDMTDGIETIGQAAQKFTNSKRGDANIRYSANLKLSDDTIDRMGEKIAANMSRAMETQTNTKRKAVQRKASTASAGIKKKMTSSRKKGKTDGDK